MGPESQPSARARLSHLGRTWWRRVWPLPRPWVFVLIAAGLLAASEVLWLWHSWPVRQVLDAGRPSTGATL
jgi:type VI secretion system protein ImpK